MHIFRRRGPVEPIYSAEINWWLLRAVRETLRLEDPELVYCSTTDWVQHKYAPDAEHSQQHLAMLDAIIGDIVNEDPEREIYITADHGMLAKTVALDPGTCTYRTRYSCQFDPDY